MLNGRTVRLVHETGAERGERQRGVTGVARSLGIGEESLRRANKILKSAAAFFKAELDRRSSK